MGHITYFRIEKLNGRTSPVELHLNRDSNILFGLNGSGKTSILRILDSALNNDTSTIKDIQFSSAIVKLHSVQYSTEFTMEFDNNKDKKPSPLNIKSPGLEEMYKIYIQESVQWKITPEAKGKQKAQVRPSSNKWHHEYLGANRLYYFKEIVGRSRIPTQPTQRESEDLVDSRFAALVQSLWATNYGGVYRNVGKIQEEGLQRILAEVLSPPDTQALPKQQVNSEDAGRAFRRMSTFLERQSAEALRHAMTSISQPEFLRRYESDLLLRNIVSYIETIESQIDEETKQSKLLSDLVKSLFSKGKGVSFDGPKIAITTDDGVEIGLERLSSGEKHLIRILLSAIQAGANPLIIDEPELSLHIDWQRSLIENIFLLSPKCQFICATHAPEIMANVTDDKIFRI